MTSASAGATELPIHLAGNNAPTADEVTAAPTRVVGTIPDDLVGMYLRNGPNPRTGWSPHLFAGDGMVHAVRLAEGEARWYRNRYVRTPLYEHPGESRMALAFDPATSRLDHRVTTANTHVIAHAGRILALEEGGFPYELTPELDTIGPFTFGDALTTAMTAHPKTCSTTGELLFFGYSIAPPHLTYYRAAQDGTVLTAQVVPVPCATMMHDFAITATRVLFVDTPVIFDRALAASGAPPWRWDEQHGARIGVLRRDDERAPVRWFEIEPCHLSHAMNAFDDGDSVVLTGCRIASLWRDGPDDLSGALPVAHQWTVDTVTGTVTETPLDDTASEYPRVADADVGRRHRYGYTASFVLDAEPDHSVIYRYDLGKGSRRRDHRFPSGHTCGEAVHVPGTGDGYLLTFVHDRGTGTSHLAILDAADVEAEPLAEVHLPVRVPAGFHGSWVP